MKSRITIIVFLCFLLSVMTGCREQVYKEGNNAANSEIIESKNNLEMKEWAVTHSKLDTTLNKAVFCGNSLFGSTEEEGGIRITEYELTGMNKKLDLFVDTIDSV